MSAFAQVALGETKSTRLLAAARDARIHRKGGVTSAHPQRQTTQSVVEQVASPTSTLTESPAADGPA